MIQVTLTYKTDTTPTSMDFNAYSYNVLNFDIEREIYKGIGVKFRDDKILGYRRQITIDFAPLLYSKEASFFLSKFLLSPPRSVTINSVTYDVTITSDDLIYQYMESVMYGNAFTIQLTEMQLQDVGDDGSTKILQPTYGLIDATEGLYTVSLIDMNSIRVFKRNNFYASRNADDLAFGYVHLFKLSFEVLDDSDKRDWLRAFLCWQNKQLDLTLIDAVQYPDPIDVIVEESTNSVLWDYVGGVVDCPQTEVLFIEKSLRTTSETVVSPIPR
jgi:hypothetical protein